MLEALGTLALGFLALCAIIYLSALALLLGAHFLGTFVEW